jgi:hypothetical protein
LICVFQGGTFMRTGSFLFSYLVLAAVSVMVTGATEEFHKRTGNACMFCHRSSSGGSPGRPNLRPEGISFIKNLIEEEAYVPENRIRQLNLLVDKIAENKALRDGTATTPPPDAQEPAVENPDVSVAAQSQGQPAPADDVSDPALSTVAAVSPVTAPAEATSGALPTTSSTGTPMATSGAIIPVAPAQELVEPGIRIKGSKTFIMKRDRGPEVPHSYLVGEDWEYDDYF